MNDFARIQAKSMCPARLALIDFAKKNNARFSSIIIFLASVVLHLAKLKKTMLENRALFLASVANSAHSVILDTDANKCNTQTYMYVERS